ncbi:MAG: 30S ribosomal protein S4e [Candidatus Hodarchaeales archaeon]|jgi:small subunit ribosomal protein S4e
MGKGSKHHQKRLASPITFPIERKKYKFTFHGIGGAHKINDGIPLGLIIREMLKYASNLRELKHILHNNQVLVDGIARQDPRFIVGPMDVISIPSIEKYYRLVPWIGRRRIKLVPISKEESLWKLSCIVNKTSVRGGHLQLNLDDGRNILIRKSETMDKDDQFSDPSVFSTRGTLKIEIPSQKILDYYPLELGNHALIIRGTNTGLSGTLQYIEKRIGKNKSIAILQSEAASENRIITAMENVFIIGKADHDTELPHYNVDHPDLSNDEPDTTEATVEA